MYFDEASGETLTKGEWEEREKFEGGGFGVLDAENGEGGEEGGGKKETEGGKKQEGNDRDKLAATIGGARKRKAGKVVGAGDGDEDAQGPAKKITTDKTKVASASASASAKTEGKKFEKGAKGAKKGKKVKLSFGDDE